MGFEPVDLRDTSAMLYQLNYKDMCWEQGHFCGFYSKYNHYFP